MRGAKSGVDPELPLSSRDLIHETPKAREQVAFLSELEYRPSRKSPITLIAIFLHWLEPRFDKRLVREVLAIAHERVLFNALDGSLQVDHTTGNPIVSLWRHIESSICREVSRRNQASAITVPTSNAVK